MNVTPCCAHSVASSGFSERKPQPGCSARAARLHGGLDDALDVEVALRGAAGAEHDDLAAARVRRVAIGLADGEHRHDAERVARARDAHGDLAAVGDQDAMEQRRRHARTLARRRVRRAHTAAVRDAVSARGSLLEPSRQASALETSNLPGASISIDFDDAVVDR